MLSVVPKQASKVPESLQIKEWWVPGPGRWRFRLLCLGSVVSVDSDVKQSDGNESKDNNNDLKRVYESTKSEVIVIDCQDSASKPFHGFGSQVFQQCSPPLELMWRQDWKKSFPGATQIFM